MLDKTWKKESSEAGEGLGQTLYQLFRKRVRYFLQAATRVASNPQHITQNMFCFFVCFLPTSLLNFVV